LLKGRAEKTCKKPTSAKATDQLYKWTWDNLKGLSAFQGWIVGSRVQSGCPA
jgi:hypothetical protein